MFLTSNKDKIIKSLEGELERAYRDRKLLDDYSKSWHRKAMEYFLEVQKANKGIRRLGTKVKRLKEKLEDK